MGAPVRPAPGGVSGLDADLWKSYNAGLRNLVFSGNKLNPKSQAFYTAPIGSFTIPAGPDVPPSVTNGAIYKVANQVLDVNSAVVTPGNTGSYVDRQSR